MPDWKQSSPDQGRWRIQTQQNAEASWRSLKAGGLPLQATRRLQEETAAGHPLFTSDLSTREFLLTRSQGYQPLSQVMGSSFYYMGARYVYTTYTDSRAVVTDGEVTTLSSAHQEATQLALGRLEQEATLLKAHGVIGVRFTRRSYKWDDEWDENVLEYTAIGTAIRLPNVPVPQHPFLSDLSGQEFWTLLQAGYYPAGVVTGYCAYFVCLGTIATSQLQYTYSNREIAPFSQGVYKARDLAMDRVVRMARDRNAFGVVGMHIECEREAVTYQEDGYRNATPPYLALWVQFSVVGTAITAQKANHVIPSPKPTLTLTDLRPGRYGQTRELTIKGM